MTEPVAAHRTGVGAGPTCRGLLLLECVLGRLLDRLVFLLFLDGLLERDAVAVPVDVLLVRGDELGQHSRERIDLMAAELGTRSEVRGLLGEHAFEPEHEAVLHLPARRRLPVPRLDLGDRVVDGTAARRPGREHACRILAFAQEGLACPGFCSEGGGRQAVRGLRLGGRNLCRLLHARSASVRCNESTRADSRTPLGEPLSQYTLLAPETAENRERVARLD